MGENTTNLQDNQTEPVESLTELTPRQLAVLDARIGGIKTKTIRQVAKKLGFSKNIVFEDLKKIKASGWYEEQVQRLQAIGGFAFANVFSHILAGKYEAGVEYMKGTGLYRPKLEVSGSIVQKLSDQEITDKAKQVILEVIQEAKVKGSVKKDDSGATKVLQLGEVKQIKGSGSEEHGATDPGDDNHRPPGGS